MYRTVREELGTHIIEVVALLKMPEISPKFIAVQDRQFLRLLIKLVESIILELNEYLYDDGGETA